MNQQLHVHPGIDPELLGTLIPLNSLMDAHRQELLNRSEVLYLFQGDTLFEIGQFDQHDYYLLSGEVGLEFAPGNVSYLKARKAFASIAHNQPRICRAFANTDATLLKVDRARLEQLVSWSQAAEHLLVDLSIQRDRDEDAVWLDTVLRSNLFLKVPPTNVDQILKHLVTQIVSAGDVVVAQGAMGDCCYFIKEGQAEVTRTAAESGVEGKVEHLADIAEGRCFGEDALIHETVRNASVTMKTDGVLLMLEKHQFLSLLKEPAVDEITATELLAEIKREQTDSEPAVLLDVRTEAEYNLGHLAESINLPLHLLHLKRRILDPSRRYIACCNSGARSRVVAHFLQKNGYNVASLQDGLTALEGGFKQQNWNRIDYILKNGQVVVGR